MKVMSERFSLKWIDFQNNAARIFDSLRTDKDFFDVTLVGGDLKQVSAHKLVLSACSPFFQVAPEPGKRQNHCR